MDPNDTKKMDFESIIKDMGNGNDIPYILMLNFGNNIPYMLNFGPLRYSSYHYDLTLKKYMEDCENSSSAVPCMDVQQLVHTNKHYANFMQVNIMKNNNILQYLNKCLRNNNIQSDYDIPYRLSILYINNNNDYEIYKNININLNKYAKEEILKGIPKINCNLIINKDECIIDNLLYYFIELLYNSLFNKYDLNTFHHNIISDYSIISTYSLRGYFEFGEDPELKTKILDIITNFSQDGTLAKMFYGGKSLENTNNKKCCNNSNSIIKRVLIILLIILIIIIIVLIVLYIINKYKNNDDFK